MAAAHGDRLLLHTKHGDVDFWSGVNLGSTTPGHSPGELATSREEYRRWFTQMGRMGVHTLRVCTVHPPAMYEELKVYDEAHRDTPIYLVQGGTSPGRRRSGQGSVSGGAGRPAAPARGR